MNILVANDLFISNTYVANLVNAYKDLGHCVVYGSSNFYISNWQPELLHIHWPEYLRLPQQTCEKKVDLIKQRLDYYKRCGACIAMTIHNLAPHDVNNELELEVYEAVLAKVGLLIHCAARSIDLVTKRYESILSKHIRHIICSHGHYLSEYQYISKKDARRALGLPLDKFVIICFGRQHDYKNPQFVRHVFKKLKLPNKYLIMTGSYCANQRFRGQNRMVEMYLRMRNKIFNNEKYNLKSIPTPELRLLLNAADVAFLGHKEGLVTGQIPMAATYKLPVVYPDLGVFSAQARHWVAEKYIKQDAASAMHAIERIYQKYNQSNSILDNSEWLANHSWEKHVRLIVDSCTDILKQ